MSGNTKTKTPATKDQIRQAIFNAKPDSRIIEFFGNDIEIRQPTMGVVMEMRKQEEVEQTTGMLINYAFVPVYDEKGNVIPGAGQEHVFEATDEESIRGIPFGPDMKRLTDAINDLLGTTPEGLEKLVKDAGKSPASGSAEADGDVGGGGAGEDS